MSRISSPAPLSERASPYQGLTPFTPEDTPYFFGREQDTEIITANLIAERLTLLYGPSGVGKSSVLGAGVVHNLRERAQRESARGDPPEYLVVFFNDWRNEPVAALTQEIEKQLRAFAPPPPAETTLAAALRAWSEQTGAELLFIFDQFEEYFLYHENDKGDETFAAQFANVLKDADGRANFLLSFREDALAKMDFFKKRIPNLFKNYLRIKHLDDDAARRAILKPLEKYNADHPAAPPVTMEPALVEEILREVQVGRVTLGESGRGAVMQENRAAIETPFLQLVLTRLWTYERERDSHVLRLASFTALGGAEKIVRGHLQNAIDALSPPQQAIAASIFDRLVTPSGAKIAQNAPDLARYARVPESELKNVLERLSGGQNRILRPVAPALDLPDVPRYEIFHDVLGAALLEWKRGYENKRRLRRIAALAVAAGALVLVFGLLALFAVRSQAEAQTAKAEANSKAQQAETSAAAAIKSEARAVAESKSAAKSAQEADTAKNAAVASANESRARLHLAEGNQAFVKNPLLGMRLALEGLALTAQQPGAQTEKMTDEAATLLKQGKFVRLGSNATGFFPNPDKTMLVVQNADAPGEVRRWRDGALVAQLAGKMNWVDSSPAPAETFVVRYVDAPDEVRRWRDGALVETLAGKVNDVTSSPAPAETFVVRYEDAPGEVRRWRDGALVAKLAGKVNDVTSSPAPAETFVVRYYDAPGEVRRWRDGALVAKLAGKVYDVTSSPAPAETFVVRYTDAPDEVRRWRDGALVAKLAGKVYWVESSPAPAETFVVRYADAPDEVRRWRDGALVAQLAGKVDWVESSPAPAETFVVRYDDAPGEVRRWRDGVLVAKLAGKVYDVYSSPEPAETFVVRYADAPGEVRRWRDGALVAQLAGDVNGVYSSPEPAETFVVRYADAPGEVRRWRDGALVAKLAGKVVQDGVTSSPAPAETFVVRYEDAPDEVRRWRDGALLATLAGKVNDVTSSPELAGAAFGPRFVERGERSFVVSYNDAPSELRRWSDGGLIAKLAGKLASSNALLYSPDAPPSAFVARYSDAPWDVRRASDGAVMAVLGLGVAETIFDSTAQRLAVLYSDGRAYLLDLYFLNAYGTADTPHSFQELEWLACTYLFEPYGFDERELKEYLEEEESRVCR